MPVAANELVYQNEKLPGNLLLFANPLVKLCLPSSIFSVAGPSTSVTTHFMFTAGITKFNKFKVATKN